MTDDDMMTSKLLLTSLLILALVGCTEIRITRDPATTPRARAGHGPPAHAPAHGYRRKFEYVHYADADVYYARDRDRWFWIEGDSWRVGTTLPDHIVVDLDGGTVVGLDSDKPYR